MWRYTQRSWSGPLRAAVGAAFRRESEGSDWCRSEPRIWAALISLLSGAAGRAAGRRMRDASLVGQGPAGGAARAGPDAAKAALPAAGLTPIELDGLHEPPLARNRRDRHHGQRHEIPHRYARHARPGTHLTATTSARPSGRSRWGGVRTPRWRARRAASSTARATICLALPPARSGICSMVLC